MAPIPRQINTSMAKRSWRSRRSPATSNCVISGVKFSDKIASFFRELFLPDSHSMHGKKGFEERVQVSGIEPVSISIGVRIGRRYPELGGFLILNRGQQIDERHVL